MKTPKFSIWYNDGTVVHGGGEDDELVPMYFSKKWLEAPADGVCQIDREDKRGTASLREWEFYFMLPANFHGEGTIGGSNKLGPFLRQAAMPYSLVKFGGWTSYENFNAIRKKSREAVRAKEHLIPVEVKDREREEDFD